MGTWSTVGSAFGPWGTAIGAGVDYYLDEEGKRSATADQMARQGVLNKQAIEQEKASIIGRVDAAKAAGIHPLVAMGAQGLGGPVVSAPYVEPTRFEMDTRGFVDQGDADVKRYNAARADLAELEVQLAAKRLSEQPGNGGAPNQMYGSGLVVPDEGSTVPSNMVAIEGQTLPPSAWSKGYQTPGVAPGWDVTQFGPGLKMVVPGGAVQRENWGEQMGELPLWMLPEVARQSAKASGMPVYEWLQRLVLGDEHMEAGQRATDQMASFGRAFKRYFAPPGRGPKQESAGRIQFRR